MLVLPKFVCLYGATVSTATLPVKNGNSFEHVVPFFIRFDEKPSSHDAFIGHEEPSTSATSGTLYVRHRPVLQCSQSEEQQSVGIYSTVVEIDRIANSSVHVTSRLVRQPGSFQESAERQL